MDKYHIYEELGAGKHSQVFKGREKMDIEYVAIKRVEKSMMDQVVNEVQVRVSSSFRAPQHKQHKTINRQLILWSSRALQVEL